MRQISLNYALVFVSFLVITLSGCQALSTNGTSQIKNLAPLSSLKTELPGLVDGVINPTANGCGGGGGCGFGWA